MNDIRPILDATIARTCDDIGLDPSLVTIENRVSHLHIHVERPELTHWPLAMTPGREAISHESHIALDWIEHVLRVLGEAHLALKHVHDIFNGPPPPWATGIHPLARFAIERSSYTFEEMIRESRSPTWKPEEREEHLLGEGSGLHVEVRLLRFGNGTTVRTRGTYSSLDTGPMTQTSRTSIAGRRLEEIMEDARGVEDLVASSAVDRPDLERTRVIVWGDLVPIEEPPAGEDPWWIARWSAYQDLKLGRSDKDHDDTVR
jgi:hypothetical protein